MADAGWTRRSVIAAALFVAIAAIQVAIPVLATFEPRPARFGWQMYSTVSPVPEVWTEDHAGTRVGVDIAPLMGDPRAEILWAEPLANALCQEPEVSAVIVLEREVERRISCS
jgi:hypothetical protein